MCTVSFVRIEDTYVFTSNRDEHQSRPSAFLPIIERKNSVNLLFPKDGEAGGTWFASNEFGTVCVLLNGAFTDYTRKTGYKKSRGLIVLDIISSRFPITAIDTMDLTNIAPFTLVLFHENELYDMRWDGRGKHKKRLSKDIPHLWSSATLYNLEEKHSRQFALQNLTQNNDKVTPKGIFELHKKDHNLGGFRIDRPTGHKTVSISQAFLDNNQIVMNYSDLTEEVNHSERLSLKKEKLQPL